MEYKWNVCAKPTGRYSSFERRGFPRAHYKGGEMAAMIDCEDRYEPSNVKIGNHRPLTVSFFDYSKSPAKRKTLVARYKTLPEAKDAFERVLKKHPEIAPKY